MIKRTIVLATLCTTTLTGCAIPIFSGTTEVADNCRISNEYMTAESRPQLVAPAGLEATDSSLRVMIPPGADVVHPELRGNMVEGEDGRLYCIDRPPPRRGLAPVR